MTTLFQVFENDIPAQYPDINVHPSWKQSKFESLELAQDYVTHWLGPYGEIGYILALDEKFYYNGADCIVIREIEE